MSKQLLNLQTANTHIQRGEIINNSPSNYDVFHSKSGSFIQSINIQKGPIEDNGMNGVLIEDLLLVAIDQLEYFQNSTFTCQENEETLTHLRAALSSTRARQYDRMIRHVQGKYEK